MNYMGEFNQFRMEYNPRAFIKKNVSEEEEVLVPYKKQMLPRLLIKDTSQ
jgi:hypothetical protein